MKHLYAKIEHIPAGHSNLESEKIRFSLEKPSIQLTKINNESLTISGWLCSLKLEKCHLLIEEKTTGTASVVYCNITREDVLNHLLISPSSLPYPLGYSFEFSSLGDYTISIVTKSIKFKIINISIYTKNYKVETENALIKAALNLHSHKEYQLPHLNPEEINTLLESKEVVSEFIDKLTRSQSIDEINHTAQENNTPTNIKAIIKIIDEIRRPEWNSEAIIRASNHQTIFSLEEHSGSILFHGSYCTEDYNFLLTSKDKLYFYIIQYCGNIGIYFPSIHCILETTPTKEWISTALKHIPKLIKWTAKLLIENNTPHPDQPRFPTSKFGGIIISQARPYHYFYDGLYGLQYCIDYGLASKETALTSIKGCDFFDINLIFKNKFKSKAHKHDSEVNEQSIQDREFYILSCLQYNDIKDLDIISRLDQELITNSEHLKPPQTLRALAIIKRQFPTLWFGISSEKRKWTSQVEGISNIANRLAKEYGKICIILDGRTFPLTPSTKDQAYKNIDDNVISQICNRLDDTVSIINTSGLTAAQKIIYAKNCDLFITSYATDSIYPSRIARRPGVVYTPANIGGARSMHIHWDIVELTYTNPSDPENTPWHISSCNIAWPDIFEKICKLLNSKAFSHLSKSI